MVTSATTLRPSFDDAMENARTRFEGILAKAKNLGVSASALTKLNSSQKLFSLRKKTSTNEKSRWCLPALQGGSAGPAIVTFLIFLVIGSFAPALGPTLRQTFRYTTSWWWGSDVRSLQCLFEMPSFVNKMTRPPMDCGICRDVTEVERVANISPSVFEQRFAYSGRPVVVQDATANWTAQETFSFDFLRSLYAQPLSNVSSANALSSSRSSCQFLPYETDFRSLSDFFAMDEERANQRTGQKPWYVGWSNCDGRVAEQLREHYGRPYFLPPFSENKNVDWIFMGSPGYGAQMHVDDVRHPSWQAQLRGAKLWSIEPPPECFYECKPFSVTVQPGEIIILDTNLWYHATKIVSEDISITIGAEYD